MKMIIDGNRYDTKAAEELASWWNGLGSNDFHHCAETLYRTKSGAFFLHGFGGALSKYGESTEGGRSQCSGSQIMPLTPDEAFEWLQQHNEVNVAERLFPHNIKDA